MAKLSHRKNSGNMFKVMYLWLEKRSKEVKFPLGEIGSVRGNKTVPITFPRRSLFGVAIRESVTTCGRRSAAGPFPAS
jgi:hypothetical protein